MTYIFKREADCHNKLYTITKLTQYSFTKVGTEHKLKNQGYLVYLAAFKILLDIYV